MFATEKDVIMAKMLKLVLIETECGEFLGSGNSQIQWELGENRGKDAGNSVTALS